MDTIRTKIRALINDNSTTVEDIFTYGSSSTFTLTESNTIAITDVERNNVASGVVHTYNTTLNTVTVSSTLVAGDTVKVTYTAYKNYSNTELDKFINAALVHISINNYYNFLYDSTTDAILPTPEPREENLIAIVASILIDPDNKSIRLPDISIQAPVGGAFQDMSTNAIISRTIGYFKKNSHGVFSLVDFYNSKQNYT